jgi:hypothetical protein
MPSYKKSVRCPSCEKAILLKIIVRAHKNRSKKEKEPVIPIDCTAPTLQRDEELECNCFACKNKSPAHGLP